MRNSIRELDTVVMRRDFPESGVRAGDIGAVVHVYDGAFEVEFVTASGRTEALFTVDAADVRLINDNDLPAVRQTVPLSGAP